MKSNADLKAIRIVKCKESDDMKLCKEDCISDCLAMEEDDMIKVTSAVNDNGIDSNGGEEELQVKDKDLVALEVEESELKVTGLVVVSDIELRTTEAIRCEESDRVKLTRDDLESDCSAVHTDKVLRDASLGKNFEESGANLAAADDDKNHIVDWGMKEENSISLQVETIEDKTNFMPEKFSEPEKVYTGFEKLNNKKEEQEENDKINTLKDEKDHNTFEHTDSIKGEVQLPDKDKNLVTLEAKGSVLEVMHSVSLSYAELRSIETLQGEEGDGVKSMEDFLKSDCMIVQANVHNELSTPTDDVVEAADLQDETFYIEEPKEAKLADENDKMVTMEMESLVKNLSLELLESEKNVMLEYEKEMKVGHVGQSDENDVGLLVEEDAKKIKLEEADSDIKSNVDKKAFQILQCEYMDEAKFGTVDSKSNYLAVHEDNVQREASLTNNVQEREPKAAKLEDQNEPNTKENNKMVGVVVDSPEKHTSLETLETREHVTSEDEEEIDVGHLGESSGNDTGFLDKEDTNKIELQEADSGIQCNDDQKPIKILLWEHMEEAELGTAEGSTLEVTDSVLVSDVELSSIETIQCEESDGSKSMEDYFESDCMMEQANVQDESSTPTYVEVETADIQDETFYIGEPKTSKLEEGNETNTEENDKIVVVEVEPSVNNLSSETLETRENVTTKDEEEMEVRHLNESSGIEVGFLVKEDTNKIKLLEADSNIKSNADKKDIQILQYEHTDESEFGTNDPKSDSLFVHVDMVQRDASLGTNIEECGASLEAADNEKKDMADCGMKEGNTTSLQVETMEEKTNLISKKSSVPEKVYTGFEKLNDEAKEQEGNNRSNTLEHEGSALEVMDSVSVSDDELGSIETLKCEESDGVKMTRDYLESDFLQVEATLKNEASTPTDVEVETVDLQHDKFYKREPVATKLEDENETIVDENTVFTEEGIPMENVSLKTIETGEIIMSEDKEDNKVGHVEPSGNEAGLIEKEDANGIEFKNVESDIRSNADQKDIQILHCEYVDKETNFTSKKFNKLEKVYIEFKKLNDEGHPRLKATTLKDVVGGVTEVLPANKLATKEDADKVAATAMQKRWEACR
ncbi:hypothetical protein OsI_01867 [Oryza sativa Indica Group]|uniref:Uncharacterized protein n=1 Tax=Oryza sativa subsp. indica TaxID=39946 RepID=B8A7W4_ORYSI|nr:hypothetical protein OsI_01867 [Oryza sativa Indica Group]